MDPDHARVHGLGGRSLIVTAVKKTSDRKPRILVVTPEITYLPPGMGNMANALTAKAGGLADVSASLVSALFELGADVHVALPHYRRMFHVDIGKLISEELRRYRSKLPRARIHLAEDRIFYYRDSIYADDGWDSLRIALAFQREIINNIIPTVSPDLVHCNDWMTGLVPAAARRLGIPCLFTVHNIHTRKLTLETIEEAGIDAADFWNYLYYVQLPGSYEQTRSTTAVDVLASGLFGAHFINTVSPTFLHEVADGRHSFVPYSVASETWNKRESGCAVGILNAPDPSFNPRTDPALPCRYDASSHEHGKLENKRALQERLGLVRNDRAPVFFWPSRLDPLQKGCDLLIHILYDVISSYWDDGLQVVMVANGKCQPCFHRVARHHDFYDRLAICDFDEPLSRLAYAASDFVLMPSLFEPCGLPQMIGSLYGSLPIANDTGGLHDTVTHLDVSANRGNGFVFQVHDDNGLRWAIDQAMAFRREPPAVRSAQVTRIMQESAATFNHSVCAQQYFDIYERMLNRPLVNPY